MAAKSTLFVGLKKMSIMTCAIVIGLSLVRCAPSNRENQSASPTPTSAARAKPPSDPSPRNLARGDGAAPDTSSEQPEHSKQTTASASPNPLESAHGDPGTGTGDTEPDPTKTSPSPDSAEESADPDSTTGPKVLYFTFDDGPSKQWTPQVLAILAKHGAKATFFQLGEAARWYPDLAADVRDAGHTIGNHTDTHPSLPSLSTAQMRTEIDRGVSSKCLRPPNGSVNPSVRSLAHDLGLNLVLWDVDPRDWSRPGVETIEKRVLDGAKAGRIILMHDGGGDRSQTVAALDPILTTLAEQGYVFRSLDC